MSKQVKYSEIVKTVGGVKTIKMLPKTDRITITLKVAQELEKETARKACAKKLVEEHIRKREYVTARETVREHGLTEAEVRKVALKVYAEKMRGKDDDIVGEVLYLKGPYYAAEVADEFGLENEKREAAMKGAEDAIYAREYDNAHEVKHTFQLSDDDMKTAALNAVERRLKKGSLQVSGPLRDAQVIGDEYYIHELKLVEEITDKYGLSEGDVFKRAEKAVQACLEEGKYEQARKIAIMYELREEQREAAIKMLEVRMAISLGIPVEEIVKTKYEFDLTDDEVKQAAVIAYEAAMKKGAYSRAEELARYFGLEEQLKAVEEIRKLVERKLKTPQPGFSDFDTDIWISGL